MKLNHNSYRDQAAVSESRHFLHRTGAMGAPKTTETRNNMAKAIVGK